MQRNPLGGARCPECDSPDSDVKDSRPVVYDEVPCVFRFRACKSCGLRFKTFEVTLALWEEPKTHRKAMRRFAEQIALQAYASLDP